MAQIVIGISDCQVSADPAATLVTYALGSCIAVMLYDPIRRAAGMLHFMLPESSLDRTKASANPFMFADTGIPTLLERFGASDRKRLQVRLAGGAQVLDPQNVFAIGRRNYLAARKELWKFGLFISGEAVGGELSRTVRLDVADGKSWLREGGKAEAEFVSTVQPPMPRVAAYVAAKRQPAALRGIGV
jgi:chemotaxis protein CheD